MSLPLSGTSPQTIRYRVVAAAVGVAVAVAMNFTVLHVGVVLCLVV